MSDDRIQVRFPDRMTVDAPQTDALINSLIAAFSALSKMLQASLVEIASTLQTLKGLPSQIGSLQTEIQHQFGMQLKAHLEAQVQMRLAAILSAGKQQAALLELKAERAASLPQDIARLTARTTRLIAEAASETTRHVRTLDSHGLDILEQVYPRQIQERFSVDSTVAFDMIAAHAGHAMTARAAAIDAALRDAQRALREVEALAATADATLERFDWGESPEPGWYEATFLVVEVEDTASGRVEVRTTLVGESDRALDSQLGAAAREMATRAQPASDADFLANADLTALGTRLTGRGASEPAQLDALCAERIQFLSV